VFLFHISWSWIYQLVWLYMLYWMLSFQYVPSTGTYGVAFLLSFYTHLLPFHGTYIHIESLLLNLYLVSWPRPFAVILSVVHCCTTLRFSHGICIYQFFYFAVVCIVRTIWWLYLLAQDWISSLTRSAACMVNSLAEACTCGNYGRTFW